MAYFQHIKFESKIALFLSLTEDLIQSVLNMLDKLHAIECMCKRKKEKEREREGRGWRERKRDRYGG